ncbi:MAG: hypothetical protein QOK11_836 [Pseudonocardiales bacterium]|nr:hypothetical protein [Pseudonocardiales bacterium]
MKAGVRAAASAAALAAAALTGCSSSSHPNAKATVAAKASVEANTTACSSAAKSVALPSGFPASFPMPPGTVVTAADDRGDAGFVVSGVTPTAFKDVLAALQTDLPAKGFTMKDGETEPHDAESDWTSAGYDGRWAIREIPQCHGDTAVSVVARKK